MIENLELPLYIQKYLQKYGLQNWKLEKNFNSFVNCAIVIPAISEFENLKILISSLLNNDSIFFDKTAFVFVINNLKSSQEIKEDNKKTISFFENILNQICDDELSKKIIQSKMKIAFVDASSEGNELPEKESGVGLARKIGMDLCLNLFDYDSSNKNFIVCLDADCTVKENYIEELHNQFNKKNLAAAVVNYEHKLPENPEHQIAIICYEVFLRYHVLGLTYANSPYAIHTIGSTMACDVESYVKIGGMNKKKAAEDFYFIEKLAKIVNVKKINSTCVYPSPRGSWRVPFGTGQRVNRHLSKIQNEFVLYSPKSFFVLKKWNEIFLNSKIENANYYSEKSEEINIELFNFLIQNNFEESWNKILQNTKDEKQINKQKKIWFDGFRTLKLIHHLRDSVFPSVNMFDALDEIFRYLKINFEINRSEEIPSIEIQIKYLEKLRELQTHGKVFI